MTPTDKPSQGTPHELLPRIHEHGSWCCRCGITVYYGRDMNTAKIRFEEHLRAAQQPTASEPPADKFRCSRGHTFGAGTPEHCPECGDSAVMPTLETFKRRIKVPSEQEMGGARALNMRLIDELLSLVPPCSYVEPHQNHCAVCDVRLLRAALQSGDNRAGIEADAVKDALQSKHESAGDVHEPAKAHLGATPNHAPAASDNDWRQSQPPGMHPQQSVPETIPAAPIGSCWDCGGLLSSDGPFRHVEGQCKSTGQTSDGERAMAGARLEEAKWWLKLTQFQHADDCTYGASDGPEGDFCSCRLRLRKKMVFDHVEELEQAAAIPASAPPPERDTPQE